MDPNTVLTSGAALVILNTILGSIKQQVADVYALARNRYVTAVDITNQDQVYFWLESWMSHHLHTSKNKAVSVTGYAAMDRADDPVIKLIPAPGFHFFRYNNRWFWMYRHREKSQASSGRVGGSAWIENVTICTLGGSRQMVLDMVNDMYRAHCSMNKRSVDIYVHNGYNWQDTTSKEFRDPKSLILKEGQMETLLKDLDAYKANKEWYKSLGIPWKRGYLFFGPPGNGKSSLILVMASYLQANIHVVNLSNSEMNDAGLQEAIANTTPNSVVVIEEIDTIFEGRKSKGGKNQQITFGGLLNAIDGLTAPEGRIFVMTTNHPEKLDPALIRPGRADMKFELSNADVYQVNRMIERFFPDSEAKVDEIPAGLSMAQVQELAVENQNNVTAFIEAIKGKGNGSK